MVRTQLSTDPVYEPGDGGYTNYVGGGYAAPAQVDTSDFVTKSTNQTITGIKKFGTETDHSTFEADGTLRMVGAATVWQDINLTRDFTPIAGAGVPVRNALVGNIVKDQFAVGDAMQFQSAEFLHDWKEGSGLQVHIHWATGGLNDATVRGVKWEVEWAVANAHEQSVASDTFGSATVTSLEFSIPAAQADRTHRVGTILTITDANIKVGAHLIMRLKRIASVTNVAPSADPFLISFGAHYETDTLGSRTVFTK